MSRNGERLALQQVRAAGLEPVSARKTGSGHIQVLVRAPDGREEKQLFCNTPGDHRNHLNKMGDLRRFAKGFNSKHERH